MNVNDFIPLWESDTKKTVRAWDFEEKWQSFHAPNGRLMSCAHRGDRNQIYPENSLEAFYSAVLAGADMLEADIRVTKDGVPIVMHDETLTRTTDLSALRAAGAKGLPKSDLVADWMLEEVRRVRPVMPDGSMTDCHIPTLEEVILLAKDRCFVTLDKTESFSFEEQIMPLIEKHDAWRTVLVPYIYDFERVSAIQEMIKEKCGHYAPYFARAERKGQMNEERMAAAIDFLREVGYAPILRSGEFFAENESITAFLQAHVKGKYRLYAESLQAPHDNEENWRKMAEAGCGILMGNRNYELIEFVRRYNKK